MASDRPLRILPDLEIAMRDGTILRADLYRPDDDLPYPVVLARTPYSKQLADPPRPWLRFAAAGYAVVVQDCRGCFRSEGQFAPFENETADGYDTIEWIAAQPWSTGRIGMYGTSYLGATQWLAAVGAPPHLTTIIPAFTASDYHDGWIYQGGALLHSFALGWALPFALRDAGRLDAPEAVRKRAAADLLEAIEHVRERLRRRPLVEVPELDRHGLAPYYREWLEHPEAGPFWERWSIEARHAQVVIPVLAFGGWYDMFLGGTIRNFLGMRQHGGSVIARGHQRVVIGGWQHGKPLFGPNPDPAFDFGAALTAFDHEALSLRWLDHWLKDVDNGVEDEPPVKLFTLGANTWRDADGWPLAGTEFVPYYLHSAGGANTTAGDGRLDREPPEQEPADFYLYDPRHPVPSHGGALFGTGGARDQGPVETNPAVLVYSSELLTEELEVTGPVTLTLYAASSARDTDFVAKLVDVYPDGRAMNLAENVVRARFRNSPRDPSPLEPGRVEKYRIDLYGISNLFKAGHRIRLEVSSSSFPRFDPNPNTGAEIAREREPVPALQTVHHDAGRASHLVLPLIPGR